MLIALHTAQPQAGTRFLSGRAASGWQLFVIHAPERTHFAFMRGGSRLKYAYDVDNPDNLVVTFEALEARLGALKPHQWVTVDQWERGATPEQLAEIKARIEVICKSARLGCVFSF